MAWQQVAVLGQLEEEEAFAVDIGTTPIALVRRGDRVFGLSNVCTHAFALMSDGIVEDDCIECPLHQARFDLETGARRSGPECADLRTFAVKLEGDNVLVDSEQRT